MTERAAGSARRAAQPGTATHKATTGVMAQEGLEVSSFGTRGVPLRLDAAPHRGTIGTLAKSRISPQYRQSKDLIKVEKRCMNIYMDI